MNKTVINDFKEIITGRRSIRNYDPTVKISREEMAEILEEASLAPSSVNLQPWRFVVIDSKEGKETLAPLAKFNQRQVETSAAVIAVFVDMKSETFIEKIYDTAVEKGYMPADVRDKQVPSIKGLMENMTFEQKKEMNLIDAGLVSMQLMLAARAHGYDTNPIGGYEKDRIADAFHLDKERYYPVMLISIGKAADQGYKSVRLPVEDITEWK
ncbi:MULTISPECIES: nitroreductase family protein [Cytobacillus]|jgi:nitroreductase|uniref:NAD(P)H nitroreductase n=2 Tax=Cytobacillus TaxID=2675230 RepID=A0A160M6M2_9BACI|nr:nitroreductase family protein [Cytobacillus oceanisediminis]MCS0825311.1 nitroreductase family protein [Cytobacillus firmus]AND38099.1 NAD(P)H nitroreductase [Cytobacillus oceanisediminis 2691]MBU8731219.1 nitroreductase family protein [Cytobacillus oceanisediminis]MCM3245105.1 nitroreductase family protein [Cytobacillus oceanisediminis]MCM3403520.1 nitroreductase family protein [Cytobacillus oceanisediminis]